MRTSLLILALAVFSAVGCSTPTGFIGPCPMGLVCVDAGTDANTVDSSILDARGDAGVDPDIDSGTGPDVDSGTDPDVDSGTDPDVDSGSPTCVEPGLGDACGDTAGGAPCPTGFDCDLGRCLPQGRETCGGFAGAPCEDPVRNQCLYETEHGDVGTCFTPSEVACLCAIDSARWCPS